MSGCSRKSRSIPACAGEPLETGLRVESAKVYPRVCGGTTAKSDILRLNYGLSPRVRGNRHRVHILVINPRSIPACAGEPPVTPPTASRGRVYPRVCGGTASTTRSRYTAQGLSPRVRGNRPGQHQEPDGVGSIPACAGEPGRPGHPGSRPKVYPRVCGGTVPGGVIMPEFGGLSPRVRGNRQPHPRTGVGRRSIPACAGEPRRRHSQLRRG